MGVTTSPAPTFGDDDAFAVMCEVCDFLAGLQVLVEQPHDRAHGNAQDEILAVCAVHALSLAMGALLRLEVMLVAIVDERGDGRVRDDDDVTTTPAVAAVRTALGNMRFAAKRRAACAAITGLDLYANLISERPCHVRFP